MTYKPRHFQNRLFLLSSSPFFYTVFEAETSSRTDWTDLSFFFSAQLLNQTENKYFFFFITHDS